MYIVHTHKWHVHGAINVTCNTCKFTLQLIRIIGNRSIQFAFGICSSSNVHVCCACERMVIVFSPICLFVAQAVRCYWMIDNERVRTKIRKNEHEFENIAKQKRQKFVICCVWRWYSIGLICLKLEYFRRIFCFRIYFFFFFFDSSTLLLNRFLFLTVSGYFPFVCVCVFLGRPVTHTKCATEIA